MLLNAEIKDDNYVELPRQQDAKYAYPSATYLKADASTGQHYVDLNAAAKNYSGAWLFGKEHVQTSFNGMNAQWIQWCPVPAGINDGVLLRGNVIYQNPDHTYRMSKDQYEGVIRTSSDIRYFIGRTQHTFTGNSVPGGYMRVMADLRIPLTQQLAYNPMIAIPPTQNASAQSSPNQGYPGSGNSGSSSAVMHYQGGYQQEVYNQPYAAGAGTQQPYSDPSAQPQYTQHPTAGIFDQPQTNSAPQTYAQESDSGF